MHIPDSAISPATSLIAWAAMAPLWRAAGRRLRESLESRQVPLLALGSAFCFTVMMFNLPVPGGTTVHATGAVLLAIALGPWAALLGVSVTLVIQALLFADGGLLCLATNCLSMAFVVPFCGFAVYRVLRGGRLRGAAREAWAAGLGAYVGTAAGALVTATLLGIQPALSSDASGQPLYFPFGLAVTVPALLLAHLSVAGVAEAVLTAAAVRYLGTARIPLGEARPDPARDRSAWFATALALLIVATPLGLLAAGSAWGEGASAATAWTLLPDYLRGHGALGYAGCAALGALVVGTLLFLGTRLLVRPARPAGGPCAQASDDARDLPSWLRSSEAAPRARRARRHGAFVERTLREISEHARDALRAERSARSRGLLQTLDPRSKIVGLFGLVIAVAFLHRVAALLFLLALCLVLVLASRIPLASFLTRVGLALGLAGALLLAPLLGFGAWAPALLLLLRVATAASLAVLLTLSTPWNELLVALGRLGAPRSFVMIALLGFRYVAVLAESASELFLARKSRVLGGAGLALEQGFAGGAAGAIFGKTLELADEVHRAMLARGFSGEARSLQVGRLGLADALWLGGTSLTAIVAIVGSLHG